MKLLHGLLLFLASVTSAEAQIPLSGHVIVPSTSDSTLGQSNVSLTASSCNIITSTGCTISNGPYVKTLNVTGNLGVTGTLTVVASPGREYTIYNHTTGGFAISVGGGSGASVSVPNGTSPVAINSPDGINFYASTVTNTLTANALAATPSTCSSGSAPTGIDVNGNALNCTTIGGGGGGFTNPMTTLGDAIYGGTAGSATRLAGPTTSGHTFFMGAQPVGSAVAPTWIDFATPPPIGGTTPAAGTFTTLSATTATVGSGIPNDTSTGTATGYLAKINSSAKLVKTLTSDTTIPAYICAAGCGTSGNAFIVTSGEQSCVFDGATTALHYVVASTTTAGACHDSGSTVIPTGAFVIGLVTSTNGSAGTYVVLLTPQYSGNGSGFSNPMTTLGDIIYGGASGTATRLAGPTTSGHTYFLAAQPSGSAIAPAWVDFAAPPAIGGTTPASGTFTNLSASTAVLGTGIPNDTSTGTATNYLAKVNSSGNLVKTTTSDTTIPAYICGSGCGTSGSAFISTSGEQNCVFDGATTSLDYVVVSTTTSGACHDVGTSTIPTGVFVIGVVTSTNGSAGTYTVLLAPQFSGSGGGGGSGLSGLTTGQVLIAGSATTATSSMPLAGAGAAIPTGPTTTGLYDVAIFGNTNGQIIDSTVPMTTLMTTTNTATLTNKRITKRVLALSANSATPAINTDNFDVVHITGQSTAITSFTSGLTGTAVDGDTLRVSITGTTSVALTWGSSFEASGTVSLPTSTVSTTRLDIAFLWNSDTSKWRVVGVQ